MRHIVELMVNPFFLCLFLLGVCLYWVWRGVYPFAVRVVLLLVFLFLIAISTGWLPKYMTHQLEFQYPVVTEVNPQVNWIVVLGGGQYQFDGMPANDLLTSASIKRLVEGVRLYRTLSHATLVLSGGSSGGDQPEGFLLAQLANWFSIPKQHIALELKSINTADQARELVAIVGEQPFYLVTSAIHMPRAMALCEQQGLHPIAAPADFTFFWYSDSWDKMIIPNPYNLTYFAIAMHEVLGRMWAKVRYSNFKST